MLTVHKYVIRTFIVTFLMTLLVFTFVMSMGVILRITDLLARGLSWRFVSSILMYGVPPALGFSIPISVLTSCLLVFGRLSADGEVTAMKSCGISMWQIVSPVLLFSLVAAIICLYINSELAPKAFYTQRRVVAKLGMESPMELLDAGRFIEDFEGYSIYIDSKEGGELLGVRIYEVSQEGEKRELRAGRGGVRQHPNGKDMILDLYDVRIFPVLKDKQAHIGKMSRVIPSVFKGGKRRKRREEYTLAELYVGLRNPEHLFPQLTEKHLAKRAGKLRVEFHKRLVLAFSCFAFVMLGIPFGVKAHRKESSIGVGISLFLVFNFYLFVIVAESLADRPALRPDLIVWAPVVISVALGTYMVRRGN